MSRTIIAVFASAFLLVELAIGKPAPPVPSTATIAAAPNPVLFGSATTIAGQVTGKKASGATVDLQSQGFPYKAPVLDGR